MNLRILFTITAIIAVLIGLALLLVPAPMLRSYGSEVNDTAIIMARLLGATNLSIAIIAWLVKDSPGSSDLRAILLAFFVGNVLGFVVSLITVLQGVGNALSWSTVVIYLLLAAGFGYYYMQSR
jgi:hypothetical protein